MSGIVGSRLNIRGSGLVGSLGTDGQVFTSSGAGAGAVYEAAAGGGLVKQVVQYTDDSVYTTTDVRTAYHQGPETDTFTLTNTSNKVFVMATAMMSSTSGDVDDPAGGYVIFYRGDIASGTALSVGTYPHDFYTSHGGAYVYVAVTLFYLDTPGGHTTYSLGHSRHNNAFNSNIAGGERDTVITMWEIEV